MGESKLQRVNRVNCGDGETLYGYHFRCPGCDTIHTVGASWTFNGDMLKPTFSPSILVTGKDANNDWEPFVCHSFMRNGLLEFLGDCTHSLAGKTVELGELPAWLVG